MTIVVYEEKLYRVLGDDLERVSKEPLYRLIRMGPRKNGEIYAFAKDCKAWVPPPRKRVWRGSGVVLEDNGRTMSVRKERSSIRYPTSLEAIYSMTVKAHLNNERAKKKLLNGRR